VLLESIPLFFLALILGIKHAYDPDHIVAVSTYIIKSKSLGQTVKMSVSWAVGHMATAGIITFLIFIYKDFFLSSVLKYFESVVGFMLILLGIVSIISYRGLELFHDHSHQTKDGGHLHPHTHEEGEVHTHFHKHMFGIGIIHGLASNDELIVLFTASLGVATLLGLISYVAIYSLGVTLGMVAFGYAMSYPLLKTRKEQVTGWAMLFFGAISILYGGLIILASPLA
jgi:ABC-type nickel/cobalt efflux system permease component RcnA